ncbi:MAG: glycosyltransferase family 2 protein, partial [Rhodospirillaceae bacterium]
MSLPITVIIFTRNEERNLPETLAAVAWAAERIVVDSLSTDRTPEIVSKTPGVTLVSKAFEGGFAAHRNWALDSVPTAHDWLLLLDADERPSPALVDEITELVQRPFQDGDPVGYLLPRRLWLNGRPRRGGRRYDYPMRLIRKGRARYEDRLVHEHILADGPEGRMQGDLDHRDEKDWARYFERHLRYATLEAEEAWTLLYGSSEAQKGTLLGSLWSKGPRRNRALKSFAYRYLPFRWVFAFVWFYVLRLGFLDGRAGFQECMGRAFYEFQVGVLLE